MSAMENRDEVLQMLERFTRLKQKDIPRELEDYLSFVARTGDTVYPWPAVKYFFRTKLSHVIMDFHDNTPSIAELPQCPNVDPFCYDRMKRTLLSRMDSFNSAPFTIQRICELLNEPRKHYTRIDKFMRAVEKNILVVSTQEPGRRRSDSENGDSLDSIVNGDLEVNVDIEMDNETFGIESNEIVTNSAAVSITNAVIPSVTTPAHAEAAPPLESTEEQEHERFNQKSEPASEELVSNAETKVEEDSHASAEVDVAKDDKECEKQTSETEGKTSEQTDGISCLEQKEDVLIETLEPNSKEEPYPKVDNAIEAELLNEKRSDVPNQNSPETTESTSTDQLTSVIVPEISNDSLDDDEPKAKMAKLSQDDAVSEKTDQNFAQDRTELPSTEPEKGIHSAESTTDSTGSTVEQHTEHNSSPQVRPESDANLHPLSDESALASSIVSSQEYSNTDPIVPSSNSETTLSQSNIVSTIENLLPSNESEIQLTDSEQSTAQLSADEPDIPDQSSLSSNESAAPSELNAYNLADKSVETIVRRANLEADEPLGNDSTLPTVERANPDDMETLSSAVVSETVMATDEEEQPRADAVDAVTPMASDASEAVKSDENAMDVDESSVEPMDQ